MKGFAQQHLLKMTLGLLAAVLFVPISSSGQGREAGVYPTIEEMGTLSS